jgi:hypothetical protein
MNARQNRRTERGRRGSALLELIMVIPLLATLLSLTYFFGGALTNQQHVKVCDRYLCWKKVYGAGGAPTPPGLNNLVFDGRAGSIGGSGGTGPIETLEDMVADVGRYSPRAEQLANDAVMDHWPRSHARTVSATFPTDVDFWQRFNGPIKHRHSREGVEWVRGQVSYLEPIRDQFLSELDDTVSGISDGTLQRNLRSLYLKRW